jgi:hypothetical protein
LLDNVTELPPPGAVLLIVTVQLDVPGPTSDPGTQPTEFTVIGVGSVIEPPCVVVPIECPPASDVDAPDKERGIVPVAVDAICRLTSAMSPPVMTVVFNPKTMQVSELDPVEQLTDLPAPVAADPGDPMADVMLAEGKPTVN